MRKQDYSTKNIATHCVRALHEESERMRRIHTRRIICTVDAVMQCMHDNLLTMIPETVSS